MKRARFEIVLEALEDPRPVEIRLRWALKHFLRFQRLRCLSIRPLPEPEPPPEPPPAAAARAA